MMHALSLLTRLCSRGSYFVCIAQSGAGAVAALPGEGSLLLPLS